ncbi:14484_t:CDS:2 [Gigaspora margarita]|uniref:14484_t:CDS:1 n=1 Tax=Gigaspora margarita TaxID=4874 RepID=A0ABN7UCA2_GIGMA|nr:14484_t:CDS:2 [Gigaspora margarita]
MTTMEEQALELSKNKAEETDDAQNQIAEDTGAWQDSDNEKIRKRLRQHFEKLYPTPNWATVPSKRKRQQMLDSSDSSDDEPPKELEIRNEPDKHNESNKKNDEYNESDTHNKSNALKILKKLLSNKKT